MNFILSPALPVEWQLMMLPYMGNTALDNDLVDCFTIHVAIVTCFFAWTVKNGIIS